MIAEIDQRGVGGVGDGEAQGGVGEAAEVFEFADGLSLRVGVAGLGGAQELEQIGFDLRGDDFGAAHHDARELRGWRCDGEREDLIGPRARKEIEDAHAIFGEPGIAPGVYHGLGFIGIEARTDEGGLDLRSQFAFEKRQVEAIPMFAGGIAQLLPMDGIAGREFIKNGEGSLAIVDVQEK